MHATQNQVTDPVTPARTLRDAAKYLARHGWIQGCYYDPTATVFTPGACVVGAIGMVCYGGPSDAPAQNFDDPGYADFENALALLSWHLLIRDGFGKSDPYKFNDAKGRTAAEVISVLTQAAEHWDRTYAADPEFDCWLKAEAAWAAEPLSHTGGAA